MLVEKVVGSPYHLIEGRSTHKCSELERGEGSHGLTWIKVNVLMSYGRSLNWMGRRAAVYVDKILKGGRPADLPVEQTSKFELIIDLRVAHELGLKVPQEILLRADEVTVTGSIGPVET